MSRTISYDRFGSDRDGRQRVRSATNGHAPFPRFILLGSNMASRIPHVSFAASFPPDTENSHPPGAFFARELEKAFVAADIENWRDVGWQISFAKNGKQIQVYFAPYDAEGSWLLGIAPLGQPSLLAKLFGRKTEPCDRALKETAAEVHALLVRHSASKIQWMFGGPPGRVATVAIPEQLDWQIVY